ncbi:Protein Jade-1 [Clonorchis sinensis]|uniref:Protein Jade-1 n=1 Tax=Clonorchis sinensis TaxID=79923 RepID=A0A8T1M9M0_CLOSI|nr:Protein Jade-1 [Clonorchis sinensis]
MPRIKEVTHLLNDWTPTFLNEKDGKPAELFDAHPLSEMMVSPEAEVGKSDSLILIENNWRSEWHRNGVQVPVLPLSAMRRSGCRRIAVNGNPRKLPYKTNPSKLWHDMNDQRFDDSLHCILDVRKRTPSSYQIDNLDYAWISIVNEERDCLDLPVITDAMLEDIMEALEQLTFLKMHQKLKELEAQTLEFDENARCDICLSYEGEDGNELVFCDGCFLCVHQACYGIPRLPEGSWICRQCEAGVKSTTTCSLCPNTGGAMKMTEDGTRWCHISCALWVPEVGFGDVELMEPVVRLENIPQARRNLLCSICRSRYGAPIQCSNKKCKVAFHVTCAFQSNLIMRQELVDRDVRLVGLCLKHSRREQQVQPPTDGTSGHMSESPHKQTGHSPTSHIPPVSRQQRLLELETNFYNLVADIDVESWLSGKTNTGGTKAAKSDSSNSVNKRLPIPEDIRRAITIYWRLKRCANFNKPLIYPPPSHWLELASKTVETTKEALAKAARLAAEQQAFDSFRRVRFGLDRARLVVDMVLQRERRKLALFRRMWRISELQMRVLDSKHFSTLSISDREFFSTVHLGDSVYDNSTLLTKHKSTKIQSSDLKLKNTESSSSLSTQEHFQTENSIPTSSACTIVNKQCTSPICVREPRTASPHSSIGKIPYEQLIVTEDIKQRLRSALALVTNNSLSGKLLPGLTKCGTRARPKRPLANLPLSRNNFIHSSNDSPWDEQAFPPTPAKRLRSSQPRSSLNDGLFLDHTVPILTKLATIRLIPGTLKLV